MRLLKSWALLQVWCRLTPLVMAAPSLHMSPAPDLPPAPESTPAPEPSPDQDPSAATEPLPELEPASFMVIPAVPLLLAEIGSIGGLLGTISFTDTYTRKLANLINRVTTPEPFNGTAYEIWWDPDHKAGAGINKQGDPPYMAAVQVGLDGSGLKGAWGDFPQICLWNIHGQLIGYNDQNIRVASLLYYGHEEYNNNQGQADMPRIPNGGLKGVGIWPAPGHEELGSNQAVYVTMVKRHFDAICVAAVFIKWPDDFDWVFDGSWGRASNMSWYYSYIYDREGRQRECFWLDHRGDLKHKKDLEEEYIGASVDSLGRAPRKDYPDYLWAANVVPEAGIPEGQDLTEGMRKNGVADYKVPLGVKWHTPSFVPGNYGPDFGNLTVNDFVTNPGKINWIMDNVHKNKRGGNPVLPLMHPRANLSDKNPKLVWEDEFNQDIPVDCLTDWYYDADDELVEPGDGRRCEFFHKWGGHEIEGCRDKPIHRWDADGHGGDFATPSLQERHARTLVNDQNSRGGAGTKELCEDPHSVGPSYANHQERVFCRMTDKTLWPFCNSEEGVSHDCFDAEAEVLVDKTRPVGKRTLYWDAIEDWHSGERFKRAA